MIISANVPHCLTFDYHMYGSEMGTLSVYTEDSSSTQTQLFTVSGDQGDTWRSAQLDIATTAGLKVRLHQFSLMSMII